MKKILAILTVLCMVLSVGSAAFAEVKVDGVPQETTQVTHEDDANYVSADASGDVLMVHGDVTGASGQRSVDSTNSAKIDVTGDVINSTYNQRGVSAEGGGEVKVGGDVTKSDRGHAVYASGTDTSVEVTGNISESGDLNAINVEKGATVEVGGDVEEKDSGHGIYATEGAEVIVNGNVTETGVEDAVIASEGATVKVGGDVTEADAGNAINATGGATTVTVEGNVTETGDGNAINATDGATVTVNGNVTGGDGGDAIFAMGGAMVKVGGDVEGVITNVVDNATIVVEGKVSGFILASDEGGRSVYVGEYAGYGNGIHYLVGLAENSAQNITDFNVTGTNNFSATSPVSGASGKEYFYTDSADPDILNNTSVTLTPRDSGKELTVSNLPAGVTSVSENGKLTLKFDSSFKGGLQNLLLILKDIAKQNPEVIAEIYVSAADYSDYVYVPEYSVATTNAELAVAAEELEEGAVKPFNLNNHTGVTLAPSVLGGTEFYTIKVLKDSSELSAGNYSFQMHHDGSVSLILSNTYLLSLENGTYDFTIMVNGQEIVFTVVVNQ